MDTVLHVSNLTKTYRVYSHRRLLAAQPLQLVTRNLQGELLYALQDVSFDVRRGEIFGIIGHNGSGKSTLLKILSGITRPDSGTIEITGRVTSLLELGVGFEAELTGRENIYMYGALIGLPRDVIAAREESIIEFSGIQPFIDAPVKSYSSGMLIRLAFATAVHTDPDILLLDEVLGVGDTEFQHRSFQAIQKAVEKGVTVVIVSHGLTFIGNFCSRVMCLNQGRVSGIGSAEQVVHAYMDSIVSREKICEIRKGESCLRVLHSGFHIEREGIPYTVARGISVNLRKWDTDFLTSEAAWTIVDLKEDEVVLRLRWGHWNLDMIWHIRIIEPDRIEWSIEYGSEMHRDVDSMEIEAMVSGSYRTYVLPEEFREFPGTVSQGFNMEYLLAQQQPRRFLGVTGSSGIHRSIVMDFSRNPLTGSSMVITGGNLMPGHILKRIYPAGKDPEPVSISIHLFTPQQLDEFWRIQQAVQAVESEGIRVSFQNGCLSLHEAGMPVTEHPGIYAIVGDHESGARWEWEIINASSGLHVRAASCVKPWVIVWRFNSVAGGIRWSIELEILEKCRIESVQVRIPICSVPERYPKGMPDFGASFEWDSSNHSMILRCSPEPPPVFPSPGRIRLGSGVISPGGSVNG